MSHIKIERPGVVIRGKEQPVGAVIEYPYFASLALVSAQKARFVSDGESISGPQRAPTGKVGANAATKPALSSTESDAKATEEETSPTVVTEETNGAASLSDDESDTADRPLGVDDLTPAMWPTEAARRVVTEVIARADHTEMGTTISNLWPGDTPASKAGRMAYLQSRMEE